MTRTELSNQLTNLVDEDDVEQLTFALEEMSDDFQQAFINEGAIDYWLTEETFDQMLYNYVEDMAAGYSAKSNNAVSDFFILYFDFEMFKRSCLINDFYEISNGIILRAYY